MYTSKEITERLKDPGLAGKVKKYMDHVHADYYRLALNLSGDSPFQVRCSIGKKNITVYTENKRAENKFLVHSRIRRRGRRGDILAVRKSGTNANEVVTNLFNVPEKWESKVTWRRLIR